MHQDPLQRIVLARFFMRADARLAKKTLATDKIQPYSEAGNRYWMVATVPIPPTELDPEVES
jgi:hypothetical protein